MSFFLKCEDGVYLSQLRFNACALPGALGERDLNIKVRSHRKAGVHNIRNLKVDALYRSLRKPAGFRELIDRGLEFGDAASKSRDQ